MLKIRLMGTAKDICWFEQRFTGSKADAEEIKAEIGRFLKEKLNLIMSEEKTLITNAGSQAAKFLGYEIKAQRVNDYIDPKGRRGANGAIALLVPAKVIEEKCKKYMKRGKATYRNNLLQDDDFCTDISARVQRTGAVLYSRTKFVLVLEVVLVYGNFIIENSCV